MGLNPPRDRQNFLWSELTREEKKEEKAEFVASWVYETKCTEEEAGVQWEQWLNAEGWTGRDEEIMMRRERYLFT